MDSYFLDNEIKSNRLILNINWAPLMILTVVGSVIFNQVYSKKFYYSLVITLMLAFAAEFWYFRLQKKNILGTRILKYFIVLVVEFTACLMLLGVGEAFALVIYFYPLIIAALYNNRKVIIFSIFLNVAALALLCFNNVVNVSMPQFRIELIGEILGTFFLCLFVLASHIRQFAGVVKTLELQEKELSDTNRKLQVANIELTNKQESLKCMNKSLLMSTKKLDEAYKELKKTQKEIIRHEKLASLGQLSAGVAHEINTPIGAIKSNVEISKLLINELKKELRITHPNQENEIVKKLEYVIENDIQACNRIEKTLKSLKNFARGDKDELQKFDVNNLIENVLVLLNSGIKCKIEIVKEFGDIPKIDCYPGLLNQAVMNLIQNAADASKNTDTIWISTGYFDDDNIFIKIKYNGMEIAEQDMDSLFDPGFSAKGDKIRAGFEMASVLRTVENHKGKIMIDSKEENSSEFTMILPIGSKAAS